MCLTPFSQPPLSDGRDLYTDIMKGEEWKIGRKLYEIVQFIPEFISEVKIAEESRGTDFGTFHLGYLYNIEATWSPAQVYACEEQDEKDDEMFYPRSIVVTPSALLLFESHKHQSRSVGMLIAWASLHRLDRVRRNITSRPQFLTLQWSDNAKPWIMHIFITEGREEQFVGHLVTQMANLGVGVEKVRKNQTKIKESDVTKEAIAQMDIEQLQEHILDYEDEIASYDLSLSTIQTLTTLYQKAIEYYSALDRLEQTTDYLERMQSLLARDDVQIVLNSYEEEKSKQQREMLDKLNMAQMAIISGGIAQIDATMNYGGGGGGMNATDSDEKPKPGKQPFNGGMAYDDDDDEEGEYDEEDEEEEEAEQVEQPPSRNKPQIDFDVGDDDDDLVSHPSTSAAHVENAFSLIEDPLMGFSSSDQTAQDLLSFGGFQDGYGMNGGGEAAVEEGDLLGLSIVGTSMKIHREDEELQVISQVDSSQDLLSFSDAPLIDLGDATIVEPTKLESPKEQKQQQATEELAKQEDDDGIELL
ncbi:hypothetical protein FGO68_gene13949 [Halteria grandinella]|uniref:Uncharacterized protein n=1 Tax=Halteria grandinella TaxID=5974 RepID=A0A8J8NVB5_HALGN|nr:hypothetical protein FGO68_gene13949 [Halteria grandinella]